MLSRKDIKTLQYTVKRVRDRLPYGGMGPSQHRSVSVSGDTYTGYFAPSDTSDETDQKVTISAGVVIVGDTQIDIEETELTITAETWIYIEVTYDSEYLAEIAQDSSYPVPESGTWKRVICYVEWDGDNSVISAVNRNVAGPVHYEG